MSAFIDQERARFAVVLICDTLGVSTSAYYARRGDPPSARAVEGARLIASRELHVANYASLYRQFASHMRNGVDRAEVRDQGRHGWKQSPQR